MALNGSGRTPRALSCQWCADNNIDAIGENSPLSVTIPGAVAAWKALHSRFGRLPWGGLFSAAVRYAHEGYPSHRRASGP